MLLFAHPTNGYASVSMVDLAYLGLGDKSVGDNPTEQCPRYDKIDRRRSTAAGRIAATEALRLLQDVSQPNTQ